MADFPDPVRIRPRAIVVMGVCASGKSTFGARLAEQIGCDFLEGDAFHSEAAVAKMRAGEPLTDEDRWPWLDRLSAALDEAVRSRGVAVAACSALKRAYRDRLTASVDAPIAFLMLKAPREALARRLETRKGHYMPPSLLDSQLAALQEPQADEPALILDAALSLNELSQAAGAWLAAQRSTISAVR